MFNIMRKSTMINQMYSELMEVYESTDYTKAELNLSVDSESKTIIIPKHVMALLLMDEDVCEQFICGMQNYPGYNIAVA